MPRSVWKGPFIAPGLLKKFKRVVEGKAGRASLLKCWDARSCSIIPDFVGYTFGVPNGKKMVPVAVTEQMINHKFGEFAFTRTLARHPTKNDNKGKPASKGKKK